MSTSFISLLLIGGLVLAVLVGLAAAVAALIVVLRRNNQRAGTGLPPRADEPVRTEQVERISREIEKINAMEAAGRITAEEAAELRAALEVERREWTAKCAEFARESGAAAAGLARKRLTKSSNAVLAGVCGGLAEWMGLDATLVRVLYVLLTLFTSAFPGILLYIILWIVMPPPDAAATGKSGAGKGVAIFLVCFLAVPLVLVVLSLLWFTVCRSTAVRHEQDAAMSRARYTAQAGLAEQQAEQNLLACIVRNRPANLTPAHRLYSIAFAAANTTDIPRIRTALEADKFCLFDGTSSDNLVANQKEVFCNGRGTLTLWIWSALPEAELWGRLNRLKLPPGCAVASLRALSGPAAPAGAEKPQ